MGTMDVQAMSHDDILDVGDRAGNCPECDGALITSVDDVAVYDSKGRVIRWELDPNWCPHCGWQMNDD